MSHRFGLWIRRVTSVGILVIGISLVVSPSDAQAYTAADINARLIGGTATPVGWDSTCWNNMRNNRNNGMPPRTAINNGGAYAGAAWVSANGQGSGTTIDVDYGTKVVNLQLNAVTFLCSSMVAPDGAGADYGYGDGRVVHNYDSPNDRPPNAIRGGVNSPALTDNRFRVDSASSTDAGRISLATNTVLQYGRDGGSRYWFAAPLSFSYTSPNPAGIVNDQTITITVIGRPMAQFYSNQEACVVNGRGQADFYYDRCPQSRSDYTITLKLKYRYDLTPSINVDRRIAEAGGYVNVTPAVNNSGPTKSRDTQWVMSTMAYAPGTSRPSGVAVTNNDGASGADVGKPCRYYQSVGAKDCRQDPVGGGRGVYEAGNPASFTQSSGNGWGNKRFVIGDYPVGTRVCYGLSVYAKDQQEGTSQTWAHSAPVCVLIGKSPKTQVHGGDLSAGKAFGSSTSGVPAANISTSTSLKEVGGSVRTFGSWIEYGIFATGTISGAGSSSVYAGGKVSATSCNVALLSFVNATSTGCIEPATVGRYATSRTIPDVASQFKVTTGTYSFGNNPTIDLSASPIQGVTTATGAIRLSGGARPIQKGRWLVINAPTATVTIAGDIRYTTDQLLTIGDIPQLLIIAKNIVISGSVSQVDAWLIVPGGVVNSCSDVPEVAPLSSSICGRPLVVNGPVMAQKLLLRRTAGSGVGTASGDPAEIFNLRPDSYLWAQARSGTNGKIQTVHTTELPPRL